MVAKSLFFGSGLSHLGRRVEWYYLENGKQAGPVSDAELDRLAASGAVQSSTLVWREGMAGWEAFSTAKAPPVVVPPVPPLPTVPQSGFTAQDRAACSQCGTVLSRSDLVLIGNNLVCARCKPFYVQKLREGVPASGSGLVYADIGTRLLAKLLDLLIIGGGAALIIGLSAAVTIPVFSRAGKQGGAEIGLVIFLAALLLVVVGGFLFQIWCLPRFGGTPGKRMLHLRVVTATGGPISWGRAFGRFFAEMLNGMIPFWIGYIIAIFDAEKRTVHDHIAGTRVVRD